MNPIHRCVAGSEGYPAIYAKTRLEHSAGFEGAPGKVVGELSRGCIAAVSSLWVISRGDAYHLKNLLETRTMISTDSPLYCLNGFARRLQVIFDGMRLAAETIDVSMERLQRQLEGIATTGKIGDLACRSFAEAFIDAWAIVDALDRFRQLYVMFARQDPEHADFSFADPRFDQIKKLRDMDQHLSKKVEQIVSTKGTALGILRWTTLLFDGTNSIIESVLLPGSPYAAHHRFSLPYFMSEPMSTTPRVVLEAGPHRAELNECIRRAQEVLESVEVQVGAAIDSAGLPREHNVDQLISFLFVPVKEG